MHFTDVLCGKMETTKPVPTEKAEAPRTISRFMYNGRCFWTVKDKYLLTHLLKAMGVCCTGVELSRKHRDSPPSGDLEGCSGRLSVLGPSSNLAAPLSWLGSSFVSSTGFRLHLQLLLTSSLLYSPLNFTLLISSRLLLQDTCLLASLGSLKPCFFQLFSFYVAHIQTFLEGDLA